MLPLSDSKMSVFDPQRAGVQDSSTLKDVKVSCCDLTQLDLAILTQGLSPTFPPTIRVTYSCLTPSPSTPLLALPRSGSAQLWHFLLRLFSSDSFGETVLLCWILLSTLLGLLLNGNCQGQHVVQIT